MHGTPLTVVGRAIGDKVGIGTGQSLGGSASTLAQPVPPCRFRQLGPVGGIPDQVLAMVT